MLLLAGAGWKDKESIGREQGVFKKREIPRSPPSADI